jgi:hypothetical protein
LTVGGIELEVGLSVVVTSDKGTSGCHPKKEGLPGQTHPTTLVFYYLLILILLFIERNVHFFGKWEKERTKHGLDGGTQ